MIDNIDYCREPLHSQYFDVIHPITNPKTPKVVSRNCPGAFFSCAIRCSTAPITGNFESHLISVWACCVCAESCFGDPVSGIVSRTQRIKSSVLSDHAPWGILGYAGAPQLVIIAGYAYIDASGGRYWGS